MSVLGYQRNWSTSLDHLVGEGEHSERNGEPKCIGGFEIYDQSVLGQLLHRQVRGLLSAQNEKPQQDGFNSTESFQYT